jgi:hypothetical protein
LVLPIWSAAVDPRVLTVRASMPGDLAGGRLFDASWSETHIVNGPSGQHLLIDRGDDLVRLDVIDGTAAAGPVVLSYDLPDDDRLDVRLSALRSLHHPAPVARSHSQLARRLLALLAVDARDAGASLREIAGTVLGPGAWPGDGEHRKSLVRRMLAAGDRMIRAGPAGVLIDRPRPKWQLEPL